MKLRSERKFSRVQSARQGLALILVALWSFTLVAIVNTGDAAALPRDTQSAPLPNAPRDENGVREGVVSVVAPDLETVQRLIGKSDRVESGNVAAYIATYSPEYKAGYYAVTTDQELNAEVVRGAIGADKPNRANVTPVIVFSSFSSKEIDQSLSTLTEFFTKNGASASYYYDPAVDAVRLETRLSVLQEGEFPATTVPVDLVEASVGESFYRENMRAPFRGGGTIFGASSGRCTSGIPAYNASGTPGYFTAAHCFSLNSFVYSSSYRSGDSITGTVTHRYGTATVDAEFVSQRTYVGRIYTGSDLSVSPPITGTYFPAAGQGNNLCFAGSTTNQVCNNNLITYAGYFCGSTGCNSDLIGLRGGTATIPGDSGGPVYGKFGTTAVKVSGIVRGYTDPLIGDTMTYAVDWRQIAATYGATLMYG